MRETATCREVHAAVDAGGSVIMRRELDPRPRSWRTRPPGTDPRTGMAEDKAAPGIGSPVAGDSLPENPYVQSMSYLES